MTDYKQLCAELADELHDFQWAVQEAGVGWACPDTESLIDRARAALAEPEPVGPTYDDLSDLCSQHGLDVDSWPLEKFDALWEIARAILARWGNTNTSRSI